MLCFIKHIFITNLQNILPLLNHIFVTFLPSREKQIVFFWYLLKTLINSAAKRTSNVYLFPGSIFEIKRSHRDSGQVNKVDGLKLSEAKKDLTTSHL